MDTAGRKKTHPRLSNKEAICYCHYRHHHHHHGHSYRSVVTTHITLPKRPSSPSLLWRSST
ncbi:hypothetical protein E2C01_029814 [Portunus trituberculatus]|uniref:Uncharacterized protein n=1 Tax=Portunus trituberculatus TaxID=210409 RepID=A0A5B7ET04_PORTR|nr:hypothetical protein [Portunus trituberculatus]